MAFDWYCSHIPENVMKTGAERRETMYLNEARFRAGLLRRLGYSKEQALDRIQRHFEWGFELHARPDFLDKVPGVIDAVYAR